MATTMQQRPEYSGLSSVGKYRVNTFTHIDNSTPRKLSEDALPSPIYRAIVHPDTPPDSVSGSPRLKFESMSLETDHDCSSID